VKYIWSLLPVCLLAFPACGISATRNVPADYPTIQQAIEASASGDLVRVAPGAYYEQLLIDGRDITLESEQGPATTTIDATYLDAALTITNCTRAMVVRGFTITRGRGSFLGGGIYVQGGSASIIGNRIQGNLGQGFGNGIMLQNSDALVLDNIIVDNANDGQSSGGGGGGGIGVLGAGNCPTCGAEIRGNLISGNSVDDFIWGGGIYLNGSGPTVIVGNVIAHNTAPQEGAGIAMINSVDARIENNLLVGNEVLQSGGTGGGVYWLVPSGSRGPFLVGNTLVDNIADFGSGVYADGFDVAARMANNVIVSATSASTVECGAFNDAHSPIIMNNDVYAPSGTPYAGLCASVDGTAGNFAVDPLFVAAGDYRLQPGSPVIDMGLDAFVAEPLDLDGRSRIFDGDGDATATVDMGAFEYPGDSIFANGFEQVAGR